MRLLLVCNGFTVKMSGGDYHIIKVANYWSKTHHVSFLIPRLGYDFVGELLAGESVFYDTPFERRAVGTLSVMVLYLLRTWKAAFSNLDGGFGVIVSSSHYPFDVIPAIIHKLRNPGSRIVVYLHGLSIPDRNIITRLFSLVYNFLGIFLIRYADLVFVINSPTREFLIRHGVKTEQIFITSNGVETTESVCSSYRKIFDACFMGRFVKNKGVFDLLRVWKKVCQARPNASLIMVGDGPERKLVRKTILELGLKENVTLFGFVFGADKLRLVVSSRLFLFPSYLESWGISVAEAMACGLPVVAYNLPVYRAIFEDKLVEVPLGDLEVMADRVVQLLEHPDYAKRIGRAGKHFIEKYDWQRVAMSEIQSILRIRGFSVNG